MYILTTTNAVLRFCTGYTLSLNENTSLARQEYVRNEMVAHYNERKNMARYSIVYAAGGGRSCERRLSIIHAALRRYTKLYIKPLSDGSHALAFFNLGEEESTLSLPTEFRFRLCIF